MIILDFLGIEMYVLWKLVRVIMASLLFLSVLTITFAIIGIIATRRK
jgi:hypothetical protein|nr:MAG TPA: hypothetical protein [Caudoviricetes sp.]